MAELAQFIDSFVRREVANATTQTRYREPLVGFADAEDPGFRALRELAEPTHLLPEELLPGAKSVVSFFIPFDEQVVQDNRAHRTRVAREWAVAYIETNALIDALVERLVVELTLRGVAAAGQPATHNWDPATLICRWSHKSVAAVAGLGRFGLHHMLITPAGCAGRFGSLVLDAGLPESLVAPPAQDDSRELCRYRQDGSCMECVQRCPAGCLTVQGLDKQRCYAWILRISEGFGELGLADVCGKCATGPCALQSAV